MSRSPGYARYWTRTTPASWQLKPWWTLLGRMSRKAAGSYMILFDCSKIWINPGTGECSDD